MRSLMLGACLLAAAVVGFHSMIASALVAARDAKAATFSERFAPALKTPSGRGLAMSEGGGVVASLGTTTGGQGSVGSSCSSHGS